MSTGERESIFRLVDHFINETKNSREIKKETIETRYSRGNERGGSVWWRACGPSLTPVFFRGRGRKKGPAYCCDVRSAGIVTLPRLPCAFVSICLPISFFIVGPPPDSSKYLQDAGENANLYQPVKFIKRGLFFSSLSSYLFT